MLMTNLSCLKLLYLLRQALDESYSQIVLTGALGNKTADTCCSCVGPEKQLLLVSTDCCVSRRYPQRDVILDNLSTSKLSLVSELVSKSPIVSSQICTIEHALLCLYPATYTITSGGITNFQHLTYVVDINNLIQASFLAVCDLSTHSFRFTQCSTPRSESCF